MGRARTNRTILPELFAYLLAAPLLFDAPTANAEQWFASPAGSDAYDCRTPYTPCQSATAAVERMAPGRHTLSLAAGSYPERIDIQHGRQVCIQGPRTGECPSTFCQNANLVSVDQFIIQDNATAWIQCLTTKQVACRQWAIGDVANVVLNGDGMIAFVLNETCRMTVNQTVWINANIAAFGVAQEYSTLRIGGEIVISRPGVTPSYFFRAIDSKIALTDARFSGYPLASGLRFTLDNGIIEFPTAGGAEAIPGNGSDAKNFSICRPCD